MIDPAKVKAAERLDGKFVLTTNDDTLSAADIALGYKGMWIIEACFRKLRTTGLGIRPMFHWTRRRIVAHVKLVRGGADDPAGRSPPRHRGRSSWTSSSA